MMQSNDTRDLRARAHDVHVSQATGQMSARAAARCLSGVMSLLSRSSSVTVMQDACAALARHEAAWTTALGHLPADVDGQIPQAILMIAVIARGILPMCGVSAMRSALAYWATETDPAEWQKLAA